MSQGVYTPQTRHDVNEYVKNKICCLRLCCGVCGAMSLPSCVVSHDVCMRARGLLTRMKNVVNSLRSPEEEEKRKKVKEEKKENDEEEEEQEEEEKEKEEKEGLVHQECCQ